MAVNKAKFQRFIEQYKARLKRAIPKALNSSGKKTVETILDRTSRGVGLRGAFKRYSKDYIKKRQSEGLRSKPNLSFSGAMLNSLDVKKAGTNKVLVHFKKREEAKKARFNQKTRPFMGVRPQEKKFIVEAFARQFRKDL